MAAVRAARQVPGPPVVVAAVAPVVVVVAVRATALVPGWVRVGAARVAGPGEAREPPKTEPPATSPGLAAFRRCAATVANPPGRGRTPSGR